MSAIFKREFKAYFKTPIGYIVLAAYYLFLGIYFSLIYSYGSPGVQTIYALCMYPVILIMTPIITMKLFSEDRRQKVDQVLFTSPVNIIGIVFGKFFAALSIYAIGLLPMIVFELIIASYVSVNILSFVYVLLGMLLLGSALISIGMFISSLTESPAISAIISLAVDIHFFIMWFFYGLITSSRYSEILKKTVILTVADRFWNNVFSIPDIVYFLSITAAFLFLCVRSLEKRRWA